MVVRVRSAAEQPLSNVRIGTAGDGSTEFTDATGHARLRLAAQTKPGSRIALQIVDPPDFVFISPWDGWAVVPSFDNDSGNYVDVVLVRRGDRRALEDASVLLAVIARSARSGAAKPAKPPSAKPVRPPKKGADLRRGSVFVSAFQAPAQPPLQASGQGLSGLVKEEAAAELGFKKSDVDKALESWGVDALTWKMVVLTALVETGGRDPFTTVMGNFDMQGVTFGIGWWSLGRGTLQKLLAQFREADRKNFDDIIGGPEVANRLIGMPVQSAAEFGASIGVERGVTLKEPWKTRFERLGRFPVFQRIQMREMRGWVDQSRRLAQEAALRSERAAAFMYDYAIQQGTNRRVIQNLPEDRSAFEREIHRTADEQESMMMIANRAIVRVPPFLKNRVRARRHAFALGKGRAGAFDVNLEQAGIGMRDIETGAPIRLANDAAVLRRLQTGWIPGQAQ